MVTKNKIQKLIESWFTIDFLLFDDDPKKKLSEGEYSDYLTTKACFLTNLYEISYRLGLSESFICTDILEVRELFNSLEDRVKVLKEDVIELMSNEKSINSIREVSLEENISIEESVFYHNKQYLLDQAFLVNLIEGEESTISDNWNMKLLHTTHLSFSKDLIKFCK
jgi:hypothetical protein